MAEDTNAAPRQERPICSKNLIAAWAMLAVAAVAYAITAVLYIGMMQGAIETDLEGIDFGLRASFFSFLFQTALAALAAVISGLELGRAGVSRCAAAITLCGAVVLLLLSFPTYALAMLF